MLLGGLNQYSQIQPYKGLCIIMINVNICLGLLCLSLYQGPCLSQVILSFVTNTITGRSSSSLQSPSIQFRIITLSLLSSALGHYSLKYPGLWISFSLVSATCFCLPCFLRFVLDQRPSSMHSSSISTIHSSFSSLSLSFSVFFLRKISDLRQKAPKIF